MGNFNDSQKETYQNKNIDDKANSAKLHGTIIPS